MTNTIEQQTPPPALWWVVAVVGALAFWAMVRLTSLEAACATTFAWALANRVTSRVTVTINTSAGSPATTGGTTDAE